MAAFIAGAFIAFFMALGAAGAAAFMAFFIAIAECKVGDTEAGAVKTYRIQK